MALLKAPYVIKVFNVVNNNNIYERLKLVKKNIKIIPLVLILFFFTNYLIYIPITNMNVSD